MHNLIGQLGPADNCSVSEYISGDDNLPACFDNEQWEKQFFSSIDPIHSPSYCIGIDEPEIEPPPPKLRNPGEAIRNLENVQEFLDSKGYISLKPLP